MIFVSNITNTFFSRREERIIYAQTNSSLPTLLSAASPTVGDKALSNKWKTPVYTLVSLPKESKGSVYTQYAYK